VDTVDTQSKSFGDLSVALGDQLVATAEIRRPPDNYFDADLIESLAEGYEWAEAAGARAIVLCSEGKHFCAGADFTGSGKAEPIAGGGARQLYAQAFRLFTAPLPVVAAVQGVAVGGGLGLACSADFRVASPQTRFSANFARISLHQGFALTLTLPAIVGQQHAWDMLYTGRRVSGTEAAEFGLADRLADDPASLRDIAHQFAAQLAESGPLALRAIRATMRGDLAQRARQAMEHELSEQEKLWPTADFAEGIAAVAERRTPRFEGR
jgi:enoyl-CoA hydratase/carnithine racemase